MSRKRKPGRPKKRTFQSKRKKKKKPILNIHPETKRGVMVIVLFVVGVLFILSFQGVGGVLGEYILKFSKLIFGTCLWLIPVAFFIGGIITFRDIHKNVFLSTLLYRVITIFIFLFFLSAFSLCLHVFVANNFFS